MLLGHEYNWLNRLFLPYDPVYVDPVVRDLASLTRWYWLTRPRDWDALIAKHFARQLATALEVNSLTQDVQSLDGDDTLTKKLQQDPRYRRRIQAAINDRVQNLGVRHARTVVAARRLPLEKLADQPEFGSLVVVDAVLAETSMLPEEVQRVTMRQVGVPEWNGNPRMASAMLCDVPGPVLGPSQPTLPLVLDMQGLRTQASCFSAALSMGRWYPYVRVVGRCCTSPGTQPYLDVLVLMMRPFPSLDTLFRSDSQPASLAGMLNYVRGRFLEPTIAAITRPESQSQDPNAAGLVAHLAANPTRFASPLYVFQLCCQLSYMSASYLNRRKPEVHRALVEYLTALGQLREALPAEVRTRVWDGCVTAPEALLPDVPLANQRDMGRTGEEPRLVS